MRQTVYVNLLIDIGDTILSLSKSFTGPGPLTDTPIGASANAMPFAQWKKYSDDPKLINSVDRWIDFIRVNPL